MLVGSPEANCPILGDNTTLHYTSEAHVVDSVKYPCTLLHSEQWVLYDQSNIDSLHEDGTPLLMLHTFGMFTQASKKIKSDIEQPVQQGDDVISKPQTQDKKH